MNDTFKDTWYTRNLDTFWTETDFAAVTAGITNVEKNTTKKSKINSNEHISSPLAEMINDK